MTVIPVNRMFLPPSEWTQQRVDFLKERWADGASCSEIGGEMDITRNAVIGKVHRLGLPGRARRINPNSRVTKYLPLTSKERTERQTARKSRADKDRSASQRIVKMVKLRSPSNGGAMVVESIVREELPQAPGFLGIKFLDLARGQCKFPRGEGAAILFCGQPRLSGQPYCPSCAAICFNYTPQPVRRSYHPLGNSKPAVF